MHHTTFENNIRFELQLRRLVWVKLFDKDREILSTCFVIGAAEDDGIVSNELTAKDHALDRIHFTHCEHEVLFPFKTLEERRLSFYKILKTNQNCIDMFFFLHQQWNWIPCLSTNDDCRLWSERWLKKWSITFLHSLWRYNSCTSCMVGCFGEVDIYVSTMNNLYFVFYIYGSLSVTGSVLLR